MDMVVKLVSSIHREGLNVNALLPASRKRGANSTPFEMRVIQHLPYTKILNGVLKAHPVFNYIFRLQWILLPCDIRDTDRIHSVLKKERTVVSLTTIDCVFAILSNCGEIAIIKNILLNGIDFLAARARLFRCF